MSRTISPEEYDALEVAAQAIACNRVIECCQPEVFKNLGYPTRIAGQAALWRYFDAMHEVRDQKDFVNLLEGMTEHEFALYKDIAERSADFAETKLGRRMVPKGALVRAIFSFRFLSRILSKGATVIELGPGSGYLAVLLASAGYRYLGTDITQAFYVLQNQLWNYLLPGKVIELATDQRTYFDLKEVGPETIVHVPWWKHVIPNAVELRDLRVDALVCNHTLREMHAWALHYNLLLHRQLSADSSYRILFVEGPGGGKSHTEAEAYKAVEDAGYARTGTFGSVMVYEPQDEPRTSTPISRIGAQGQLDQIVADHRRAPSTITLKQYRGVQESIARGSPLLNQDERLFSYLYGEGYYS